MTDRPTLLLELASDWAVPYGPRFVGAIEAIDAVNAADPEMVTLSDGAAWCSPPRLMPSRCGVGAAPGARRGRRSCWRRGPITSAGGECHARLQHRRLCRLPALANRSQRSQA
ncbi:MAG: hypothetical protein R2699_16940 [Acidimicrobiales bacterium]